MTIPFYPQSLRCLTVQPAKAWELFEVTSDYDPLFLEDYSLEIYLRCKTPIPKGWILLAGGNSEKVNPGDLDYCEIPSGEDEGLVRACRNSIFGIALFDRDKFQHWNPDSKRYVARPSTVRLLECPISVDRKQEGVWSPRTNRQKRAFGEAWGILGDIFFQEFVDGEMEELCMDADAVLIESFLRQARRYLESLSIDTSHYKDGAFCF